MAGWTPALIAPALWLDADDASTITIATGVSEWRDKSGNNRHASQPTSGLQPALTPAGLNGKNVVSWDGSGKILSGTMTKNFTAQSVFQVLKFATGCPQYARAYTQDAGGNDWDYPGAYLVCRRHAPTTEWLSQTGSTTFANQPLTIDIPLIVGSVHNGSLASNRSYGGAETTYSMALNINIMNFRLGRDYLDSGTYGRFAGFVAEIIVLDYPASTDQRTKIEGYLAW